MKVKQEHFFISNSNVPTSLRDFKCHTRRTVENMRRKYLEDTGNIAQKNNNHPQSRHTENHRPSGESENHLAPR